MFLPFSGMAIGLILAPFTAGISAAVAGVVGVAISLAGAGTTIGGYFIGEKISKKRLKKMEKRWAAFQGKFRLCSEKKLKKYEGKTEMAEIVGDAVKDWYKMCCVLRIADSSEEIVTGAVQLVRTGKLVIAGASAASKTTASVAKVASAFGSFGAVLNFIGMGISIFDIVQGARAIHNKETSSAEDHVRKLAQELGDMIETIKEVEKLYV
jgi:large-conductance mechanosensitive channel